MFSGVDQAQRVGNFAVRDGCGHFIIPSIGVGRRCDVLYGLGPTFDGWACGVPGRQICCEFLDGKLQRTERLTVGI